MSKYEPRHLLSTRRSRRPLAIASAMVLGVAIFVPAVASALDTPNACVKALVEAAEIRDFYDAADDQTLTSAERTERTRDLGLATKAERTCAPVTTTTSTTSTSTTTTSTTLAPTTTTSTSIPASGGFFEDFSSATSLQDGFVFHVGNACTFDQSCRPENQPSWDFPITEWSGDHSMACEGPTTARMVHVADRNEMVWYCAPGGAATGHVMSSLNTTGYNILSFSPNRTFTNVSRVCWDINATDLGGGKWTNVVLVPAAEYVRHPNTVGAHPAEGPYRMDYTTPGFNANNAPGDFNIQTGDVLPGNGPWGLKNFRESLMLFDGDNGLWSTQTAPVTTDKAARFRHCMIDTPTGVQVTRDHVNGGTDIYTVPGVHMPDGDVRVIFQDDNYDPPKRDGYSDANLTWHWDNIEIS